MIYPKTLFVRSLPSLINHQPSRAPTFLSAKTEISRALLIRNKAKGKKIKQNVQVTSCDPLFFHVFTILTIRHAIIIMRVKSIKYHK